MTEAPRSVRPARLRSMARRVALVAVTSAALGGLAAAAVAIVAVDRLVATQADQRLLAATVTLGGELDEESGEKRRESLVETIDDENGEILSSGIRLAVFEQGKLLAGDLWMREPVAGGCESRRVEGTRVRFCSTHYDSWSLVAAQPIDESWLYRAYALAALGAVVLGAVSGAISSLALSRWAVRPLRALSLALRASRPEAPGTLALGRPGDCEEVEAIRSAVLELGARLQILLDQAHRFAADAAHELRTPLTALQTELELLSEESPEGARAAIDRTSARVARVSTLVERLLVLALPADNLKSGFETVALSDIAQEVVGELGAGERERVHLETDSEGLVRGDPRLLVSLVANAVQNSLKFAATGVVQLSVRDAQAGSGSGSPEVTVEIRDSGPGVPRELRERVFEPFYRARPAATTGQGLGLALIGHIARAHGGRAWFAEAEQGARLVITLPAWSGASPAREAS